MNKKAPIHKLPVRWALALTAILVAVVFGGIQVFTGGNGLGGAEPKVEHVDPKAAVGRSAPEAVAAAYVQAFLYTCERDGAGEVLAARSWPQLPAEEHASRLDMRWARHDCKSSPVRDVETELLPGAYRVQAFVRVSSPDCHPTKLPMIKRQGRWYVSEESEESVYPEHICRELIALDPKVEIDRSNPEAVAAAYVQAFLYTCERDGAGRVLAALAWPPTLVGERTSDLDERPEPSRCGLISHVETELLPGAHGVQAFVRVSSPECHPTEFPMTERGGRWYVHRELDVVVFSVDICRK